MCTYSTSRYTIAYIFPKSKYIHIFVHNILIYILATYIGKTHVLYGSIYCILYTFCILSIHFVYIVLENRDI
jgi:hypothetical protein